MRVTHMIIRKRTYIVLLMVIFIFVGLIFRLGYLQLYKTHWLTDKAEDLWRRDIPVEGKRGKILDQSEKELVYNISAPTVIAIPAQIKDKEMTAEKLAPILNMSQEKIFQLISKRTLMVYLAPGGRKISEDVANQILRLRLPGIALTEENRRYYPYGSLAAHVLGFTGIDNQGLTGIELVYDDKLKGQRGSISFFSDAKGREIPNERDFYKEPIHGLDLVLTLDLNIQKFVERELDKAIEKYNPEGIVALVMNPNTGAVLGMANRPTYFPSDYKNYPQEVYNRNLAIWKTFEPGSTFKIVTIAAALEEGKVNLKESFFDPGFILVANHRIRCWKAGGHGQQSFLQVVENSCNPGFVTLGQRLGEELLFSYIRKLGFGQKTNIDLPGEASGLLFKPSQVGPLELATTAFGQGVSVTPIQQVAAVSAIINGGQKVQPHIVKGWKDPVTNMYVIKNELEKGERVISAETSELVRLTLESVVANGTGKNAYIDGYRVGGKTGTAQKVGPDGRYLKNNHIVSFIGFAPADKPEVVVYVAVDNPQGIQFGGLVTAPIVKGIMEDTLQYLKVEKRKDQLELEYRYDDTRYYDVPNLIGQDIKDVRKNLQHFQLEIIGEGNKVINQLPKGDQRLPGDTMIRVYLGN
ncbi:stage V sporulation protein D [Desulfuribacillus stibiiarsenatis]|uniref:Stage V sporulation protein D n=1 Tax=Desulfuribacillus stibiiarsenatis TaxID=1390249 RepID=A0A1E5L3P7_9FIRM|nr:stage V sporulation protein D [Desulfuribacillus stibiiarsenatis]OEH84706.1 stage V sporulation protein D [Desulfuribacillus stibiiarsenatis]